MAKSKVTPVSAGGITIDTEVAMPTFKRSGGTRAQVYPFDQLGVGHSFHVPESEDNPDPVARVRSSLSNARDRYAEEATDEHGDKIMYVRNTRAGKREYARKRLTRDFKVVKVGHEDPAGPGARVFRVPV